MNLFGFIDVTIADILDILMVAAVIFFLYKWIRKSSAMDIFVAIILLFVLRIVVNALHMEMMSMLLGAIVDIGAVALVVIFQPEIRHFLMRLGSRTGGVSFFDRILRRKNVGMAADSLNELAAACEEMSEQKVGALIVIPGKNAIEDIIATGDVVDAKISQRLIENIFFKNSPLHDGAMVLGRDRIVAARCTLPITQSQVPPRYGMRHKAAIGLSEASDARVIVVSEQTGRISFVSDGVITPIDNINTLKVLVSAVRE